MKKILLTLLVAVGSVTVYAQLGVTAGLNIAKYSYKNGSDRKSLTSFNGGLLYRASISKDFKWQPEIIFSGKGAVSIPVAGNPQGAAKYTNNLNYVQFGSPFIYNTSFDGGEKYTFDFGAGPYAAYLISAKRKTEKTDGTVTKTDFSIGSGTTDDFKAVDFGATFLTGVVIDKKFGVHVKYDLGLRNLEPNYSVKLHTGNLSLNVSYFFGN